MNSIELLKKNCSPSTGIWSPACRQASDCRAGTSTIPATGVGISHHRILEGAASNNRSVLSGQSRGEDVSRDDCDGEHSRQVQVSQTELCGQASGDREAEEAAKSEGEDQQEVHEQVQEEDWECQGEGEDEEVQRSLWESQTEASQQGPPGQLGREGHEGNGVAGDEDDNIPKNTQGKVRSD